MTKKWDTKSAYIHVRAMLRNINRAKHLAEIYGYDFPEWVREAIVYYNPGKHGKKKNDRS